MRKQLARLGRWLVNRFDSTAAAPQYWVGISVYEGGDPDAAAAAFEQLQQQEHQLPGDREWMSGDRHVRKFKVV